MSVCAGMGQNNPTNPNLEGHEVILIRTLACEMTLLAVAFSPLKPGRLSLILPPCKIEDLMNVNVTSASKKEQKISEVAAAIFVISEEDIRRSGATNISDLLRMVPGLEVAQINPSSWAISARGFNGEYSTKLLVLIDGRTVYTPAFPGCTGMHRTCRSNRSLGSRSYGARR